MVRDDIVFLSVEQFPRRHGVHVWFLVASDFCHQSLKLDDSNHKQCGQSSTDPQSAYRSSFLHSQL
jgi:hypothetical protein